MKRILVIDGGGAKGLIAATVLRRIVQKVELEIFDLFDLVWGTSVGGIIGGVVSCGNTVMDTFYPTFLSAIPKVFTPQPHIPFIGNKYSRDPVNELIDEYIGLDFPMKECSTKFVCTSVNMVDGRNHYFKSWEKKDGELTMLTAISRTYAAPYYFGSIKDKANNAVWIDGGTGNMSSPTIEAYVEACRQRWLAKEHVHILSIGCGTSSYSMPFSKAASAKALRQIFYYMSPVDGGLARRQSDLTFEEALHGIAANSNNLSFQRVEKYDLDKKMDIMDGVKYLDDYVRIGEQLAETVDYKYLM
jgi:hypothetical protein